MYLLDTNICIPLIDKKLPGEWMSFVFVNPLDCFLSHVVLAELYAWPEATLTYIERLDEFAISLPVIPFQLAISKQSGYIRRSKKSIKLPDAMIAATAMVQDLTLLTDNTKDFANIDGLQILNPFTTLPPSAEPAAAAGG